MFLLDDADRFEHVSETFAAWFETDAAAFAGRRARSVLVPADRDGFEATVARVRGASGLSSSVYRCRLVDGDETLPVRLELVSMPAERTGGDGDGGSATGVLGFVRTAETLERTRTELATARDRFGHLFDLIQDAVVEFEIVDMVPVVRSVNPAFEEVFGYDAAEIVGESLNEYIVPPDRGGQAVDFDERTAEGKVNYAVITRRTAAGDREFLYRGIPYERENGGRYGFAVYTDITDQRRRRRHLEVLHRVLRHNLRNDLTVIEGVAASLCREADDSELQAQLDLIRDHTQALQAVSEKARQIERTLDRTDQLTSVDLASVVDRVLDRCSDRYPDATLESYVERSTVVAASPAIETAVEELVENAVEHSSTSPDGDDGREAGPTVQVAAVVDGDEVLVTVADDGPGIPARDRAVVFDDAEITQLRHGSGLGLWLVRWVTEAAGGTMVYDRHDGWTSVTLCLPRDENETVPGTTADDATDTSTRTD